MGLLKASKLQKTDTIGIVSPSWGGAGLFPHRFKKGIEQLEKLGLKVKIGKHARKITDYTAGDPRERAEDLNTMFADKDIKAIICAIGGNHSNQILDYLDFSLVKKNPKIFVGYSDATVLHLALHTQSEMITFYGPAVLTQFAENPEILSYTKEYFEKALFLDNAIGRVRPSKLWTDEVLDWAEKKDLLRPRKMKRNAGWKWLIEGTAKGKLLGGCISSLTHLRGTKYWPSFKNSIFFWEIPEGESFNEGESLANVDSYLTDLKLSGVFKETNGVVIGRPYRYSVEDTAKLEKIILNHTKGYNFPVLFNVDFGHSDPMITIPLGVRATLDSSKSVFNIEEPGVK